MAQKLRKADIIRKKNFGGLADGAQRVHAETLKNRCQGCGKLAINRIQSFVPVVELQARPKLLEALYIRYGRRAPVAGSVNNITMACRLPVMELKSGKVVMMDDIHVCPSCTPAAERAFAKSTPSYCLVDITYGPDPTKIIVSPG